MRNEWTRHLTGVVIATCQAMGWRAVGRGHLAEVLLVPQQEYLALDIMAFPGTALRPWLCPVAVFELENRERGDIVAYAIWKTGLVWCPFVFCYRQQPGGGLPRWLFQAVYLGRESRTVAPVAINEEVKGHGRVEAVASGGGSPGGPA